MAKAKEEKSKALDDEGVLTLIAELPKGTREVVAFETLEHGRTRTEFRELWLQNLGVQVDGCCGS